ncbi:MAG: 5-formyltetrahydrofolate cyclo-ligase [Candidatus Omnitrophica bacterium]|nr:5-formyltetrahydrofolate cyclo-ligase [Candidatus Omnitrophota bacterium]
MTKGSIRNRIILELKTQKEDDRRRKSSVIAVKLFRSTVFKKAKTVMFYLSFGGEVYTEKMIREALNLGKKVVVPICKKNRIINACVLSYDAKLQRGPYGILEPVDKESVRPQDLDLVIVPGVAFDLKGRRLGRGKGYYDRFLKKLPEDIPTVGLGFDFQLLPAVPATTNDINVKRVISN